MLSCVAVSQVWPLMTCTPVYPSEMLNVCIVWLSLITVYKCSSFDQTTGRWMSGEARRCANGANVYSKQGFGIVYHEGPFTDVGN